MGTLLLNGLDFFGGHHYGFMRLSLENFMTIICELNCKLFGMNSFQLEGLISKMDKYALQFFVLLS